MFTIKPSDAQSAGPPLAWPTPDEARWVVPAIPALFWAGETLIVEGFSAIPALAPPHVWLWRISMGVWAGLVFIWLLWLVRNSRRLSETTLQRSLLVIWVLSAFANLSVLLLTPATFAILAALMLTSLASGIYFRPAVMISQVVVLAAIMLMPLYVALPGQQRMDAPAWLCVYLPVVWLMVGLLARGRMGINRARETLEHAADTDPLTQLVNRRELRRVIESDSGLPGGGLLLIDLDNFKVANTLYGHPGGDHALIAVAASLRSAARAGHVVARIGGDELAVFIPKASYDELREFARIYRDAVRSANEGLGLAGVELDASVGIANRPADGDTMIELLAAADRSMYTQKSARRNRRAVPRGGTTARVPGAVGGLRVLGGGAGRGVLARRTRVARLPGSGLNVLGPSQVAGFIGCSSAAMLVSLSLNGPRVIDRPVVVSICALGILASVAVAVLRPAERVLSHPFVDLAVAAGIVVLLRLSGGFSSPAMPLVIVCVVIASVGTWTHSLRASLATPELIELTPLQYARRLRARGPRKLLREIALPLSRSFVLPPLVALSPFAYSFGHTPRYSAPAMAFLASFLLVGFCIACALAAGLFTMSVLEQQALTEATTDALTGLANRRAFVEDLQLCIDREGASRKRGGFAVVVIDLDNFGAVNNAYGHETGDVLLRDIAGALQAATRPQDRVARIGGDEFAAVLVDADGATALARARAYVNAVASHTAPTDDAVIADVTASAGMALYPVHGTTIDELISRADEALMAVKREGKASAQSGSALPVAATH